LRRNLGGILERDLLVDGVDDGDIDGDRPPLYQRGQVLIGA
jgi:hypothetical protein